MSLILNQDYGFTAGGLVRFAVNRWLRLFPVYYAVIGLTASYIALIGPLNQLNRAISLPSTATAIFANLSIVTLTGFDFAPEMRRLSPTAWSFGESQIFCYLLLAMYCRGISIATAVHADGRRGNHIGSTLHQFRSTTLWLSEIIMPCCRPA